MSRVTLDRTAPPTRPAPDLDEAQRSVVAHRSGPLLVLAGPGTGKTTTLVEAMIGRLTDPIAPVPATAVLGLTFGRRAALDWRERVAARCPSGLVPDVLTFHSFAYALVRRFGVTDLFAPLPQVISSADQLRRVRELLVSPVSDLGWPSEWDRARSTLGFAAEVQEVVSRARTLGLGPTHLIATGVATQNATWQAAGRFLGEYLDVLDAERVIDYAELIQAARDLLHRPEVRSEVQRRYSAVFVDEFQDTDAAAQDLLHDLVGPETALVVVGDPDQSIYSFRGADRSGIVEFRDSYAAGGKSAPTVVLDRTRRFGPVIREAATRLLHNGVVPGLSTEALRRHREPVCDAEFAGLVEIATFDSEGAQAAFVADTLRRAHLEGYDDQAPVAWDDMAVLVRSGVRTIPVLRRALSLAGVPVEVVGDEVPLRQEAAVLALLKALEITGSPLTASAEDVTQLLLGPLGHVDPGELRAFARALRANARQLLGAGAPLPASAELLCEAFIEPGETALFDGAAVAALRRMRRVINAAAAARDAGPHAVLWELWSGTNWAERLERESLAGGPRGRRADRDLDAVCALFDLAARAEQRSAGRKGVDVFRHEVAEQEIPTEPGTSATLRGQGIRLLTAHRAKGLEWRFVVVYGMQERAWPDLRRRGSLLAAARVGPAGVVDEPTTSEVLAEERRLAYVACTRAKERLFVTAVKGGADDVTPSRFLDDLAGPAPQDGGETASTEGVTRRHHNGRLPRPLSLTGIVAQLRTTAVTGPPALRDAATLRLAQLAAEFDSHGAPLAAAAAPDNWWGVLPFTASPIAVRPAQTAVHLSASQVESFLECPLAWFLKHEAGGQVGKSTAMGFGSVLHAIADGVTSGELAPDVASITELLDKWWGQLGYDAPWHADAERRAAVAAVSAFLKWHERTTDRVPLMSEAGFDFDMEVPGDRVHLRGSVDRVDRGGDDRAYVVDFKTGKSAATNNEVAANVQLAIYQLAIAEGALRSATTNNPVDLPPAGAELVYLRLADAKGLPKNRVQAAYAETSEDDEPAISSRPGITAALAQVASGIRAEQFPARPEETKCGRCDVRVACPAVDAGTEVSL